MLIFTKKYAIFIRKNTYFVLSEFTNKNGFIV